MLGSDENQTGAGASHLHPLLHGARAVLFDVGGTLLHPDWPRLARLAEEETGRVFSAAEMRRKLCEALRTLDAGLRDGHDHTEKTRRPGWLFRDMYTALGLDDTACDRLGARLHAAHGERHLWCGLDPEAPRVLTGLKHAGLRIAVISNTEDGRLQELLELAEIAAHFDFLIDSYVVGRRKPDAAIFHLALERLGLAPRQVVYVGDSYGHDVLGAQGAGLSAILLDPLDLYQGSECPRIRALGELLN